MTFALTPLPGLAVKKNKVAAPGAPAGVRPLMIIGYASQGAEATPGPYTSLTTLQTDLVGGSLVEAGAFALSPYGGVGTVHCVNTGSAVDGSYGSITSDFADPDAPTIAGSAAVLPDDALEVGVVFTVGGTVGTTGIRYKFTVDNGFSYFGERELGTATSIALPFGAGTYLINPPALALVALANDIRTQALAHFPKTSGSVHGAADTTSDDGIGIAAVTNANAVTLANTLRTGILAHFARGSTVHLTADVTSGVAIPASAATEQEARLLLIALGAALNTHEEDLTYHTLADTNLVTEAAPSPGVITAADAFTLQTTAPATDAAGYIAAIRSLRAYAGDFGVILFSDPITGSLLNTIAAELEGLWDYGKFRSAIVAFRLPTSGETYLQYKAAASTSFGAYATTEIRVGGGGVRAFSPLMVSASGYARPLRPPAWWVACARARSQPETCLQGLPSASGVELKDSRGNTLPRCFDEQETPWSVEVRMIGMRTNPKKNPSGVYVTQDELLYAVDSPWVLGPYTDVSNHLTETVQAYLVNTLGQGFPDPPGAPFSEATRHRLEVGAQSLAEQEGPKKRRCYQVVIKLAAEAGLNGRVDWEGTLVPLSYNVNGGSLTMSLSSLAIGGTVTT